MFSRSVQGARTPEGGFPIKKRATEEKRGARKLGKGEKVAAFWDPVSQLRKRT